MKISYNWLKDFLDVDLPAAEAAGLLTDVGLEVESWQPWESVRGGLRGLVVGEVVQVEPHPGADRLRVTHVRINEGEPLQIVCGAANVAVGQKVAVALPGTQLHTYAGKQLSIAEATIRGVVSQGMICAEDELGIGPGHDGILVLPSSAPLGAPLYEVLNVEEDVIFTIGLTPNRGDAMSHLGVARDLMAALRARKHLPLSLRMPDVNNFHGHADVACIPIVISNQQDCLRYCGLVMEGVTVQPAPLWLQSRLQRLGLRPLNNVVDITNLVMWECGQPLHAFDADQLPMPAIEVGNLPSGTTFETLDSAKLTLHADDLMICSGGQGLCIAGVYGGKSSGVTQSTKRIFLESACFRPDAVRRTSLRHQLRTDAALHFEKGTDPEACLYALKRAALLITELAGGRCSLPVDVYPYPVHRRRIVLPWAQLNRLAGTTVPPQQARDILLDLDFTISEQNDQFIVTLAPTAKQDVQQAQDVMEEILRIRGLDAIDASSRLLAAVPRKPLPDLEVLQRRLAYFLTANGFHEIITNSITNSGRARQLAGMEAQAIVQLLGSANAGLDSLRTHLLFGGLEVVAHNLNRQQPWLRLFEVGQVYRRLTGQFAEEPILALWLCGNHRTETWMEKSQPLDFFHAKGIMEALWSCLGLEEPRPEAHADALMEGIRWSFGEPLAFVGRVRQRVLQHFDIAQTVWYGELYLNSVLQHGHRRKIQFRPLPRFPSVRRDLALIVPDTVSYHALKQRALESIPRYLTEVNLFDVYRDEKLGAGRMSYAMSFQFQPDEKTFTDRQVDEFMEMLIRTFEQEFHAIVRR